MRSSIYAQNKFILIFISTKSISSRLTSRLTVKYQLENQVWNPVSWNAQTYNTLFLSLETAFKRHWWACLYYLFSSCKLYLRTTAIPMKQSFAGKQRRIKEVSPRHRARWMTEFGAVAWPSMAATQAGSSYRRHAVCKKWGWGGEGRRWTEGVM